MSDMPSVRKFLKWQNYKHQLYGRYHYNGIDEFEIWWKDDDYFLIQGEKIAGRNDKSKGELYYFNIPNANQYCKNKSNALFWNSGKFRYGAVFDTALDFQWERINEDNFKEEFKLKTYLSNFYYE